MPMVRRFWIEFDVRECSPPWFGKAIGVTGFDVRDCLAMAADLITDGPLPPVRRIVADISLAEPLPVNPRGLGVPVWRGVWYPPRNLTTGPIHDIDRRGAPPDHPAPVTEPLRRARVSESMGASTAWWDEIPHIDGLLWPLVDMHRARYARGMRLSASALRDALARDTTYGKMLCEALDFMIAWRPTPEEWFDPTGIRFADQWELDEYLRAFRDYLFGTRQEPICPPGAGQLPLEAESQLLTDD
ncbi:hypothetical protein [Nocardia sp. IFM 10818]